jgi:hypothetical protein
MASTPNTPQPTPAYPIPDKPLTLSLDGHGDHRYGVKNRRPNWLNQRPETTLNPETPVHLMNDIDTSYDRATILSNASIPEVVPVMLGLRSLIAERRIARTQEKIEVLAERDKVIRYVGESIMKRVGYYKVKPEPGVNPALRPVTWQDRRAALRLEKITGKRRNHQVEAVHLSDSYPGIENHGSRNPLHAYTPGTRSKRELWNVGKNHKHHHHAQEKIKRLDKRFMKVVGQPSKKIDRLAKKRDKLIVKSKAIEDAKL